MADEPDNARPERSLAEIDPQDTLPPQERGIFDDVDEMSGRFQDAIPGLFGALFGAGVLGWGAGWSQFFSYLFNLDEWASQAQLRDDESTRTVVIALLYLLLPVIREPLAESP